MLLNLIILTSNIRPVSSGTTITVPDDYLTIQEAINHASAGDTVFVRTGTYHENVVVNKTLTLAGENKYTAIIDGNHTGNVVYVTVNAVNITGFTIRNSGQDSKAGILVGRLWDIQSSGNNISGNIITSNYYGIMLAESFNSTISNNIVTNNTIGVQDQSRHYDCDIWTMNADGSNQTLLTTDELWDDGPEWYPNDSKILFERISNPFVEDYMWDIWVMKADGTNQTQLTTDSEVNMLGGWSPNCSLIVYNSRRSGNDDIWIMDSDGTNHKQLTTDPATDGMPTWSPDGTKIAFISDRTGNQDMWIMNADGTNQTRLTVGIPWVMGGSWSPDSSKIVFHSIEGEWNGNWDIWTINSDGTNPAKLFSSPSREAFPHWSPDGTKIAYGSDEAGSWDIWIMNPDGTNRSRITTQWDTEEICSWSPDGSELAFARAEWSLPSYNKITDNTIAENQQEGIRLQQAIGVTVEGNLIYGNGHGLVLYQTHGNTIADNTVTNNTQGIAPGGVAGFGVGIYLNMAGSNTLRNNSMPDNRFNFCVDAHSIEDYSNDIDESNTANGKRIYYWLNQKDKQVPSDAACVLLINSTNILVENLNVSNHCGFGVLLWSTTNSTVRNVISSNNANGIGLTLSSGNVVENNTVTDILPQVGIWLQDASYNTLRNNIMLRNVMSFGAVSNGPSVSIQAWMNDIDNSNTIDGKPIYYWVGQHNLAVPNDAAVAYLVNCSGITIRDLSVSNTFLGITLVNTNNSVIDNVTTHYCVDGVAMVFSNNNSISNSLITDGVWWSSGGVLIGCDNNTIMNSTFSNMLAFQAPSGGPPSGFGLFVIGNNNKVFHNSFMDNTVHIGSMQSSEGNVWDDSYPSGGNYYSNYTGDDAFCGPYQNVSGSDGIGDTPYIVDPGNQDHYPLIKPYGIQHDIGITNVTTAKTIVGQGYSLNVSARIVNYGLNAETFNVTAFYDCHNWDASLVGCWSLDEGSGTLAHDGSGNDNHGTIYGASWVDGKFGKALSFDGVDDYVEIPQDPNLNPTTITVDTWIKAKPTGDYQLVVDKSHGFVDATGWELEIYPDGRIGFGYGNGDPGWSGAYARSTSVLTDNVWHHVAGTLDGATIRIYVDGVLENATAYAGTPQTNSRPVHIGMAWGGGTPQRFFNGLIDEIKIYNRALSQEEIVASMVYYGIIGTQTITLISGGSTTATFTWNTTGFAKGNYTISVMADIVSGETDTADNSFVDGIVTIAMAGDINADGKVDVKDVYAVAKAYGTSLEGPNPPGRTYHPNCDINDDGKVDVKDYYVVCKHYGETDP